MYDIEAEIEDIIYFLRTKQFETAKILIDALIAYSQARENV
jgi:hypothetical protein